MYINLDYVTLMIYNELYRKKVNKMQTQNESDNKNPINLNEIIFHIWDGAAADQDAPYFDFVKIHDQILMSGIKKYSAAIGNIDFSSLDSLQKENMIENMSTDLFDSITKANMDYLRHGMKIGARLLAELVI